MHQRHLTPRLRFRDNTVNPPTSHSQSRRELLTERFSNVERFMVDRFTPIRPSSVNDTLWNSYDFSQSRQLPPPHLPRSLPRPHIVPDDLIRHAPHPVPHQQRHKDVAPPPPGTQSFPVHMPTPHHLPSTINGTVSDRSENWKKEEDFYDKMEKDLLEESSRQLDQLEAYINQARKGYPLPDLSRGEPLPPVPSHQKEIYPVGDRRPPLDSMGDRPRPSHDPLPPRPPRHHSSDLGYPDGLPSRKLDSYLGPAPARRPPPSERRSLTPPPPKYRREQPYRKRRTPDHLYHKQRASRSRASPKKMRLEDVMTYDEMLMQHRRSVCKFEIRSVRVVRFLRFLSLY